MAGNNKIQTILSSAGVGIAIGIIGKIIEHKMQETHVDRLALKNSELQLQKAQSDKYIDSKLITKLLEEKQKLKMDLEESETSLSIVNQAYASYKKSHELVQYHPVLSPEPRSYINRPASADESILNDCLTNNELSIGIDRWGRVTNVINSSNIDIGDIKITYQEPRGCCVIFSPLETSLGFLDAYIIYIENMVGFLSVSLSILPIILVGLLINSLITRLRIFVLSYNFITNLSVLYYLTQSTCFYHKIILNFYLCLFFFALFFDFINLIGLIDIVIKYLFR
jgi:hypothetical protein